MNDFILVPTPAFTLAMITRPTFSVTNVKKKTVITDSETL